MEIAKIRKSNTGTLYATIKEDQSHVTVRITFPNNKEENELFYPVAEFHEKGITKVLKENGYKVIKKY